MGKRTSLWVTGGLAIGMIGTSGCATWAPPPDYRGSASRVARRSHGRCSLGPRGSRTSTPIDGRRHALSHPDRTGKTRRLWRRAPGRRGRSDAGGDPGRQGRDDLRRCARARAGFLACQAGGRRSRNAARRPSIETERRRDVVGLRTARRALPGAVLRTARAARRRYTSNQSQGHRRRWASCRRSRNSRRSPSRRSRAEAPPWQRRFEGSSPYCWVFRANLVKTGPIGRPGGVSWRPISASARFAGTGRSRILRRDR